MAERQPSRSRSPQRLPQAEQPDPPAVPLPRWSQTFQSQYLPELQEQAAEDYQWWVDHFRAGAAAATEVSGEAKTAVHQAVKSVQTAMLTWQAAERARRAANNLVTEAEESMLYNTGRPPTAAAAAAAADNTDNTNIIGVLSEHRRQDRSVVNLNISIECFCSEGSD